MSVTPQVRTRRVLLARPRGYCAGVDRAVETVEKALEPADDVQVVHDLLADVDRGPVQLERLLDRLDGPVDPGAVAARPGEQHPPGAGARVGARVV